MALVTISRAHRRWDVESGYAAVLDGRPAGHLYDGGELTLTVAPGEHRLHFVNAYDRSHSIEFRVGEEAHVRLSCSASPGGLRVLLLPYYALRRGRSVRFEYLRGAEAVRWKRQTGVHGWLPKQLVGWPVSR